MASLNIPPSQGATFSVRAFNVCPPSVTTRLPAAFFFQPAIPGRDIFSPPVFAFLLEHSKTGKRYLFDLGSRKDSENLAPPISALLTKGFMSVPVPKDITELLIDEGIALDTITSVIWSHSHYDHVGDMSLFPKSVKLIVGEGTDTAGYPSNPAGKVLDSDFANRDVETVLFSGSSVLDIGTYRAVDLFKDSSLFLLDTPGHTAGHMSALVRVTDDSFVLLGGDTCHTPGQLRPTESLHTAIPCPGHLLALAQETISGEYFQPVDSNGKFVLRERKSPLLEAPATGIHEDVEEARRSISKLTVLDASPDVFVILAHDETLVKLISMGGENGDLPVQGLDVRDWKARGWKEDFVWSFVEPKNAYMFSPASQ